MNRLSKWFWFPLILSTLTVTINCQSAPDFPEYPQRITLTDQREQLISYDLDQNFSPDYFQLQNHLGRIVELRLTSPDHSPQTVLLDEISNPDVPHFIIALDGVPYALINQLYQQGHFRLFHPPAQVISCFPSMTDLAFQQIFHSAQPLAYQAKHFDRSSNRMIPGNRIYLSGQNADWTNHLDYRCSTVLDAVSYVIPNFVFNRELSAMLNLFRRPGADTRIAYTVATAGLATQKGRSGILEFLRTIDRFCQQLVFEHKGRVKITLLADHGHNLLGCRRIRFDRLLQENNFHLTDCLQDPRDVVMVDYGLVTYAAVFTGQPAQLAPILLQHPAVDLICYPKKQTIIVQNITGKAVIRHRDQRFSYTVETGDPLQLVPIIEQLRQTNKIDQDGFIDDRALFCATYDHTCPDPLRRIYQAFCGLVQKPADLIVCLKDGFCHGSDAFDAFIESASTHGSLNQSNSATFLMTMLGPTPQPLRLQDIMPALEQLRTGSNKSPH